MNKKIWIILIIILVIVAFAFFFFTKNNRNNSNTENTNTSYDANKTSSVINNTENESQTNNTNTSNQSNEDSNTEKQSSNTETPNPAPTSQIVEQQISTFTTKIYSQDSARQNNIAITCKALNGTTVKKGETFSFCTTIGPSTTSKGYQKADIYDNNGEKKKGLGGGNCQISSTLYNAILAIPSIKVTERHAHSNKVPYVAKGKDAAVAYGSYDLKFVNNTGNDIKIRSEASKTAVTVSIISLKAQ